MGYRDSRRYGADPKGTEKGLLVDTEPTLNEQLLAHSKRQTEAQESLRQIAFVWSCIAALGAAIWLIALVASH
jgi:hypothetical protein